MGRSLPTAAHPADLPLRVVSSCIGGMALAAALFSCGSKSTTPDTTPPARITDLGARITPAGLTLSWTAPGDDGATGRVTRYDLRHGQGDLAADWDAAVPMPLAAVPVSAGRTEMVILPTPAPGRWHFGVKAADEASNWSELSNIASLTVIAPDTIPPATILDLAVTAVTRSSVDLRWTAPGDDGTAGTAAAYDLRYAAGPITPETWPAAVRVNGLNPPAAGGAIETFTVDGLAPGQEYAFAVRASDEAGNRSGLSNTATALLAVDGPFQLTFNTTTYGAYDADWSPDGSRIAFTGGVTLHLDWTRPQIHVVAAGGGDPVRYTSFPSEGAHSAAWSPAGDRFAFAKDVPVGRYTPAVLAVMDVVPEASYRVVADHGLARAGNPRWSSDGSFILYSARTGYPPDPILSELYTVPSGGGTPAQVLGSTEMGGFDLSPDDTRIVYSMKQDGAYNLWLMPLSGGEKSPLTTGTTNRWSPVWAPDGSRIAYTADDTIWIIPATGGEAVRAITDSGRISSPAWSPDGTMLAYRKSVDQRTNIWIAPVLR